MLHKPGVTEKSCALRRRNAVGRHSIAGAASGQALPDQLLCRGAGGLPHRAGRNRAALARRILRSASKRPWSGAAERIDALSAAFLNAAGANVHDLLRHPSAHGDSSDRAGGTGGAGARRMAAAERTAICCSPSSSAMRSRPASGSRSRPAITTEAGTSPRPAACSAPPPAPASWRRSTSARWCGRSAMPPRNRPACANVWARRRKA